MYYYVAIITYYYKIIIADSYIFKILLIITSLLQFITKPLSCIITYYYKIIIAYFYNIITSLLHIITVINRIITNHNYYCYCFLLLRVMTRSL